MYTTSGHPRLGLHPSALILAVLCLAVASSAIAGPASSSNSVYIGPKTIVLGDSADMGIFVSNAVPIQGLVLPLEVRPVTPGAYPGPGWSIKENPNGRVNKSPLGDANPDSVSGWPEAVRVSRTTCIASAPPCSGPVSGTYATDIDSCLDTDLPRAFLFAAASSGVPSAGQPTTMPAGDDALVYDSASFQLHIGVPPLGTFEIDTCCWLPANHLSFIASDISLIVPTFTKGVVTVVCNCPCFADPSCDGVPDLIDVIYAVNQVFRGFPVTQDPQCPKQQVDVDCDGVVTINDVVRIIDVAFRGVDKASAFCHPCPL
jgi:hypothetical protein